jgi:hypothetical protein
MNRLRRGLMLAAVAPWATGLSGCASPAEQVTKVYSETVSSLLISQDNKHVVVIGSHYHYVFDAPGALVQVLASGLHENLDGVLSDFHVDASGAITGHYQLRLRPGLSSELETAATAFGFTPSTPQQSARLLEGQLSGKRFLDNALRANRFRQTLNRSYVVEITAEQGRGDRFVEAIASPVTVAAEGVTLLYYIALAPVLIPFAVVSQEKKK